LAYGWVRTLGYSAHVGLDYTALLPHEHRSTSFEAEILLPVTKQHQRN